MSRYYTQDIRDVAPGSHYAVIDGNGRSLDRSPLIVASGLYPREAHYVAEALNAGTLEAFPVPRPAEFSTYENGRRLWGALAPNVIARIAGECIAVCAACGARVEVSPVAGIPPTITHQQEHGQECSRTGWPVVDATLDSEGEQCTVRNWEASA